jgi:YhcH/YjgK/YiaL family protein
MILDHISNAHLYDALNPHFKKAFDFLSKTSFTELAVGKYEIDGDNVFAMLSEYNTKDEKNCRPEAHQKYIDIQFMVAGFEWIGYSRLDGQKVTDVYNEQKDIVFFESEIDRIPLREGFFTVLYPTDLHAPCIKEGEIKQNRKVVVKVKADF